MRNIINNNNEDSSEAFEVYQHIILKNFWEYYLEEADEHGNAFGYVMGDYNEWGNVDVKEIEPYIISRASGDELGDVMPPFQYHWENE